jgi:hypothetical protein
VSKGSGGLNDPWDLTFGPNGNLFVASMGGGQVLEYNGSTGAFVTTFVASSLGFAPEFLTFGPNGNLFVQSNLQVLEYNGGTGAFVTTFVSSGSGGLGTPAGLTFGPNGNLFVANYYLSEVLEYNGSTGAFVASFLTGACCALAGPFDLTFGPNGNLFVTSINNGQVLEYNGSTGAFVTTFVSSGTVGNPGFLVFSTPEPGTWLLEGCGLAILIAAGRNSRWFARRPRFITPSIQKQQIAKSC